MAILEYLEELHPQPPLLPRAAAERARVRSMAQLVACEIHPLNNTRVLGYLEQELRLSEQGRRLATLERFVWGNASARLVYWDGTTGKPLHRVLLSPKVRRSAWTE